MAYDLMLSEHGDLVFSATRDLQGVSGVFQVAQSIRTRLKIHRGSWDYDPDGILGSQLYALATEHPDLVSQKASIMVTEALRGMEDVVIDQVLSEFQGSSLHINVLFHVTGESGILYSSTSSQISIVIPVGG